MVRLNAAAMSQKLACRNATSGRRPGQAAEEEEAAVTLVDWLVSSRNTLLPATLNPRIIA